MSKILIIDSKLNSVIVEITPQQLKMLGIKPENVVKHRSRRQLLLDLDEFLKKYKNI